MHAPSRPTWKAPAVAAVAVGLCAGIAAPGAGAGFADDDPCRLEAAIMRTASAAAEQQVLRGMLTRVGGAEIAAGERVTCALATEGYGQLRLVVTPGGRGLPVKVLVGHVADPRTPAAVLATSTSGIIDVDLRGAKVIFVSVRNRSKLPRTLRISYWLSV